MEFGDAAKDNSDLPDDSPNSPKASLHQLISFIENINGGVSAVEYGDDGSVRHTFTNNRYYELFGYTREQYDEELRLPFAVVAPEDSAFVRSTLDDIVATGRANSFRFSARKRDGSLIRVRCSASASTIEGLGKRVLLSVMSDVTDIVKAERQALVTSQRLDAIIGNISSGVVASIIREDGAVEYIFVSDRYYEILGYTREQYHEEVRDHFELVHSRDVDEVRRSASALMKPGETAELKYRAIRRDGSVVWLSVSITIMSFADVADPVHLSVFTDITKRKEAEDRQRISEEMLRIAAETDKRALIIYDVKANTCHIESRNIFSAKYGESFADIPDSVIDMGIVAPDSVPVIRSLFKRIRSGETPVCVSMQLRVGEGGYEWFECNASSVLDSDGRPDHAVLVFHNITEQRIKEAVFQKWRQSIVNRPEDSYTLFRSNISRSAGLDEQRGSLLRIDYGQKPLSFNERTEEYVRRFVCPEDRESYSELLDSGKLLARFYQGEHSMTLEYRELGEDGGLYWRLLTVEMVEYLNSTDVQAFLLYEDIDEKKKAELDELERAETDPLTGVLNRAAFSKRVDELLPGESGGQHALMMMDLDGFKLLNDTFGHAAGDQALLDVAAVIRTLIREGDLICRLGGDEFLVWLRGVSYDAVIEKTARQLCERVRKAFRRDVRISASVGVAVYPRDGSSFDELYHCADRAMYKVKRSSKDGYAFFSVSDNEQPPGGEEAIEEVSLAPRSPVRSKRRMLIVDDSQLDRLLLSNCFKDEFIIETARSGAEAMIRLHHFGSSLSVVLLDMVMDGMDGFEVLKKIQSNMDLQPIPVIVVSGDDERASILKAIEGGATDYVTKPVDLDLIRLRVQSAISKAENERLRAQNSYLQLQRDEELKFRTVLESTGTVVVEYDWRNHVFAYDNEISKYIAGDYNHRGLWQVFLADMVADSSDVKTVQELLITLANSRGEKQAQSLIMLRTPANDRHWFRVHIYKSEDSFGLAEKMIITFNDVHEEVLSGEQLLFQATRDELTGLYNRAGFIEKAAQYIAQKPAGYFVMSCIDIEKFKVINDQFGTEKGDSVLRRFADSLRASLESRGALCCRIMADNFAVLFPKGLVGTPELDASHRIAAQVDPAIPPLKFYVGRYVVDDKSLDISAIYDRASIAKDTVKGRYDSYIATYDKSMLDSILRQQEITGQMNSALESGQFEVWFQPQFDHANGTLTGAEALVRWRHPTEGIISPAEFIPIFEQNGFIYEMDKFVWEQACVYLRKWLEQGLQPVPVSVNISRYDVFRDDIIQVITGLVARYELPVDLLRLEITESAFSESTDQIIRVVKDLVQLGFVVEIDDFGSGYSSLNTLKDVPAQVLKMDMRFLENDSNSQRGGSIIESVARMAKWLGMSMIAEGVETIEQADYLSSIGCGNVQGYLYSRPVEAAQYERLFTERRAERSQSDLKTTGSWDSNEFWNPKSMETLIFNSYVGGACILEYHRGELEILRTNEQYAREMGSIKPDGSWLATDIMRYLDGDNRSLFVNCVEAAIVAECESSCELVLVDAEKQSGTEYIRLTLRVIARSGERYLFYCVINNLTLQRQAEMKEREAERKSLAAAEQLQAIVSNIDGGVSAVTWNGERSVTLFSNDKFYDLLGYTRAEFEAMDTAELDFVHPDDRQRVLSLALKADEDRLPYSADYRIVRRDGGVRWLRKNVTVMRLPGQLLPVHLSVLLDITQQTEANEQLQFLNEMARELLAQPDADSGLNNALRRLREHFGGDRSYIFEFNSRRGVAKNTYESCAEGVPREKFNLQSLPLSPITEWLEEIKHTGYYATSDRDSTGASRAEAKNVFAVPLYRENRLIGLFGVDNPRMQLTQLNRLVALGDYIAVILTRRDLNAQIAREDSELLSHLHRQSAGLRELNDRSRGAPRRRISPQALLLVTLALCLALAASIIFSAARWDSAAANPFIEPVITLSDGWSLSDGSGLTREAALPQTLPYTEGGEYTLSRQLPTDGEQIAAPALGVYSNYMDLSVELDGERLYSYAGEADLPRRATGNTYHYIRLPADYAGKTVKLTLRCQLGGDIDYLVRAPLLGSKASMLYDAVTDSLPFILLTGGMFIFTAVLTTLYLLWRRKVELSSSVAYMSLFAVLFAMYTFCETTLAQNIISDGYSLFCFTLLLLALIPIPFVGLLSEDVGKRFHSVPVCLIILCALNMTAQMVLHYTGVMSLRAMVPATHAVLIVSIVLMLLCLVLTDKAEKPGSRRKLLSAVPVFAGGFVDIVLIAAGHASLNNSLWFTLGVTCFILIQFITFARSFFVMFRMNLETNILRDMAYRDSLTDIGNRNAYERRLRELAGREADGTLCCLTLEIADLKAINETYDRATGDAAVVEISRILERIMPDCGVCFRISEDEFVVLLDGYEERRARELAGKLSVKTEQCGRQYNIPLRLSIGFGAYGPDDGSVDGLVRRVSRQTQTVL